MMMLCGLLSLSQCSRSFLLAVGRYLSLSGVQQAACGSCGAECGLLWRPIAPCYPFDRSRLRPVKPQGLFTTTAEPLTLWSIYLRPKALQHPLLIVRTRSPILHLDEKHSCTPHVNLSEAVIVYLKIRLRRICPCHGHGSPPNFTTIISITSDFKHALRPATGALSVLKHFGERRSEARKKKKQRLRLDKQEKPSRFSIRCGDSLAWRVVPGCWPACVRWVLLLLLLLLRARLRLPPRPV